MSSLTHENRLNPATGRTERYWKIAYREGEKQRRLAIGFCPAPEAREAFKRWEARRVLGLAETPPPVAPPCSLTLREWWADGGRMSLWLAARGLQTKMPLDCARPAILREIGALGLKEVTAAAIDRMLGAWRAGAPGRKPYMPRTCQLYADWLRRSLEVAQADGLIATVPTFTRIRLTERKGHRWLMPTQTVVMLGELDSGVRTPPQSAAAIRVAEALTLRPGEVLTRRWADVVREGWSSGVLLIRPQTMPDGSTWRPKKESSRALPLNAAILATLRDEWIRQGQPADGWIFPGRGDASKPLTTFRGSLKGACARSNLPKLHPHALRHTGATRMALNGVSRKTMMEIGGWRSGAMLDDVYEHTGSAEVERALGVTQRVLPSPKAAAGDS